MPLNGAPQQTGPVRPSRAPVLVKYTRMGHGGRDSCDVSIGWFLVWNWLRVLRSADVSRLGHGVGDSPIRERYSQKNAGDSVAEHRAGMRMIATFFEPVRSV